MKVAFLQKSLGGVLRHTMTDLPSDGGRWDNTPAPTVTLKSKAGGEIVASRSATLGPSLTIGGTSASSVGATSLTLTSTTGLKRWRDYVVGPNASGQWEWATVDGFTSTTVTLLDGLAYSYSTGQSFKSHDLEVTYSSSDVGSVYHNAYAEWAYTVDSTKRKEQTITHVSRYAPRLGLSATEVLAEEPRARRVIGSNQRIDLMLRRIFDRRVLPDIGKVFRPGALVSGEAADEAVLARFRLEVSLAAKDREGADDFRVRYTECIDELRDSMVDLDEDGAQGDDEVPRSVRNPRILRG